MKKIIFLLLTVLSYNTFAQEHFSGIGTSKRISLLNGTFNPAELANLSSKVDVQLFATSFIVTNNKIGFSDLTSDADFDNLLFVGDDPVNMRFDAEILGPGVAFKIKKWGFGVASKVYAKFNLVDIDVNIGDAIVNSDLNSLLNTTILDENNNQRIIGTSYGELAFSVARNVWETEKYKFNSGATIKLLFPGSYANFGIEQFNGTITSVNGNSFLSDASANVNISYSGNLANDYTNFDDYSNSIFGGLKGMAADFGASFTIKDSLDGYKFNTGISVRNIGRMTFSNSNNSNSNYTLSIPANESLNLNQFENVNSIRDIEQILLDSEYLSSTSENRDFKVKLPTVINLYADIKIIPTFYASVFLQQKLNDDGKNDQITAQNLITLTPRFSLRHFEVFTPISQTEIAGFNTGFGLRAYGFFIGSGSIVTALLNDSKQADFYFGYRLGLGKI
jgi:hypothetical protein